MSVIDKNFGSCLLFKITSEAAVTYGRYKKAAADNATQRTFSFTGVERENAVQAKKILFIKFFDFGVFLFSGKLFWIAFWRLTPVEESILRVALSIEFFL